MEKAITALLGAVGAFIASIFVGLIVSVIVDGIHALNDEPKNDNGESLFVILLGSTFIALVTFIGLITA